jgi:hypothetical protein
MIFGKYAGNFIWQHGQLTPFVIKIRQNLKSARLIVVCKSSFRKHGNRFSSLLDLFRNGFPNIVPNFLFRCYFKLAPSSVYIGTFFCKLGGGGQRILPEIWISMLKIHLKCNNFNKAFCDWLHCHTKFREKRGVGGPLPENFYIFEALGLHFWRFLKQVRKQIGYKSTIFCKNGYHFTKIITYYANFTWKRQNFNLNFTWFLFHPPHPRSLPTSFPMLLPFLGRYVPGYT